VKTKYDVEWSTTYGYTDIACLYTVINCCYMNKHRLKGKANAGVW